MKAPIHLNALRAFEASARHGSFVQAAAELNVTPAAVGQLVRSLEEHLGLPLFHRVGRGRPRLVLTDVGKCALPDIQAGFERLGMGFSRLENGPPSNILNVAVNSAFAAKWLLPRIDRFQAACPDTNVRFDMSPKLTALASHGIDIGVRYGAGSWAGLSAEILMHEGVYPVCSPGLMQQMPPLRRPEDLLMHTLIHDLSLDAQSGFPNWITWLQRAGVAEMELPGGMSINNSAAVLQVALDGGGIALARSVMAQDDVATGRLIRLFPQVEYRSSLSYYIVSCANSTMPQKAKAFRDWLVQEASSDKN